MKLAIITEHFRCIETSLCCAERCMSGPIRKRTGVVMPDCGGAKEMLHDIVSKKRPPRETESGTQTKSREYRRPLGRRAAASAKCGKAAQNRGKSLPFSWPVHRYSDLTCEIRVLR